MKMGDSWYGEQRDRLELKTTDAQDLACAYLEGHGQRFLVDFGYENAIEKAAYLPLRGDHCTEDYKTSWISTTPGPLQAARR
jgi:hypothetical protein